MRSKNSARRSCADTSLLNCVTVRCSSKPERSIMPFKKIAVFCGSSKGSKPEYVEAAKALGKELSARGISLVYGGGSVGLMGAVAGAVKDGGGQVEGVIPKALIPKELSGEAIGVVHQVDNMHERKAKMSDLADAFIALPGGYGTLEELLEIITWNQLGILCKPVAVLNIEGYFEKLLGLFDHGVQEGFIRPTLREIVLSGNSPGEVLDALEHFKAPKSLIELKSGLPTTVR